MRVCHCPPRIRVNLSFLYARGEPTNHGGGLRLLGLAQN